ncbi:hypothetical protein [uncultured Hyphomonas sp.]|uniref:hypothetical protein n=1 Tax=uncultured Hyphomonas sp. TaxID=225298 RepID=UPI002AAB9D49|nr:hypothetical protein [uncultured Hyphomonas sp.]
MRHAGLCLTLLLIPTACDDAVGSGYPGESPPAEERVAEPADDAAVPALSDAGSTPEDRAASLGLSQEMDYACDKPDMSAHVVLYGNEEVVAVLIPGKVNVPLYLECSATRIGPECSDGQFTAHLNTLEDTAMFFALKDASPLTCTMVPPELSPQIE